MQKENERKKNREQNRVVEPSSTHKTQTHKRGKKKAEEPGGGVERGEEAESENSGEI